MNAEFDEAYFRSVYRDYERQNPEGKLRFYRDLARRAVGDVERPRVLDAGCAFGRFLATLDAQWELHGIDSSEYAIASARQSIPGARLRVGRLPEIPFEGRFDLITAFDVIEHVPTLTAVLSSVRERLSEGGHFLFVVPVYDGPTGPAIRRLDRDPTHVHREPRRFWLEWVAGGLDLVEWWGIYRYLLPWGPYLHLPTRRLRAWTPAIAVLARRAALAT